MIVRYCIIQERQIEKMESLAHIAEQKIEIVKELCRLFSQGLSLRGARDSANDCTVSDEIRYDR